MVVPAMVVFATLGAFRSSLNSVSSIDLCPPPKGICGRKHTLPLVYKVGCAFVNKCFVWLDKIGYELYLVHSLAYTISFKLLIDKFPIYVVALIAFCFAVVFAKGFSVLVRKI